MFHHIVNIKCKRGDRTALHRRMKSFGRAVVKSQPGAVSCTYHANVGETTTARHVGPGSTQGYTHVFVCAFKSRRDFDHYMTSEIHRQARQSAGPRLRQARQRTPRLRLPNPLSDSGLCAKAIDKPR